MARGQKSNSPNKGVGKGGNQINQARRALLAARDPNDDRAFFRVDGDGVVYLWVRSDAVVGWLTTSLKGFKRNMNDIGFSKCPDNDDGFMVFRHKDLTSLGDDVFNAVYAAACKGTKVGAKPANGSPKCKCKDQPKARPGAKKGSPSAKSPGPSAPTTPARTPSVTRRMPSATPGRRPSGSSLGMPGLNTPFGTPCGTPYNGDSDSDGDGDDSVDGGAPCTSSSSSASSSSSSSVSSSSSSSVSSTSTMFVAAVDQSAPCPPSTAASSAMCVAVVDQSAPWHPSATTAASSSSAASSTVASSNAHVAGSSSANANGAHAQSRSSSSSAPRTLFVALPFAQVHWTMNNGNCDSPDLWSPSQANNNDDDCPDLLLQALPTYHPSAPRMDDAAFYRGGHPGPALNDNDILNCDLGHTDGLGFDMSGLTLDMSDANVRSASPCLGDLGYVDGHVDFSAFLQDDVTDGTSGPPDGDPP